MTIEVMSARGLRKRRNKNGLKSEGPLDLPEAVEIGAQHPALKHKACEFAFAHDLNQARGFEFLEVMRDCCRADLVGLVQVAARHRAVAGTDGLQHFIAARLGQRASDPRELPVGQAMSLSFGHDLEGSWCAPEVQRCRKGSNAALPWAFMRGRFAPGLKGVPFGP